MFTLDRLLSPVEKGCMKERNLLTVVRGESHESLGCSNLWDLGTLIYRDLGLWVKALRLSRARLSLSMSRRQVSQSPGISELGEIL